MECPKCHHQNPTEAKFCMECGAKLENVCPQCGAKLPEEAKFCMKCGAKVGAVKESPKAAPPSAAVPKLEDMQKQLQSRIPQSLADRLFAGAEQMQGEYRLVTAIFADVSGSSGMAREMPLEQYVDTMNDCFKMMVDTISIEYEGSINRFIGDCVLAFFGAPITHENDAERAILAALDIRDGVKELNIDVSIGINTGMTYVGEMGSDLYFEHSAWGPDVDFAKRLQEAAKPGEVYVGASTYRLTSRAFDFERPIDIEVKGMEKRQIAYPVLRVREHPEKLRGIEGLRARMIGREREFADLKEAADNLISGKGCIVSITGEAGLGKSRLALELKEYLVERDASSFYEGRSISIGQTVSYWPFLDILRTYLNLSDADSESDVARKLKESMTDLFPHRSEDILPFLGHLLPIRFGDELDDKLAYFTPEQIRHQTLMRLRDVFTAIARRKPLLLILEDLHWADDLSLDLLSLLMDELAANPLMLLCIYRPEREHRCWQISDVASRKCLERYTEITLKQLSAVQSRQLVESLLEIENLPEPTKDMILTKSEGNPFFIEEVIRSLIDRELVYREGDRWKAKREIEDIDVPDTIQSVLLSRVDRLEAETKYVLQCASVIGRLFHYRVLEHLAQHERNLEEHLSQLEEQELVYEERTVPELEYAFKHALTQEATYQGILERRRVEFHRRVADGIENLYRERIEEFYEELAHHHRLGQNDEKAIEYLLKSGIKAAGQFASQDALRYFNQAEELLDKSEREHREEKVMLYGKRGEVLQRVGRWTEAIKEYEEALRWCDDAHDRAEIYQKMGWLECEDMQDKASALKHFELGLKELPEDDRSIQRVRLEHDIVWADTPWERGPHEYRILRCQQAAKIAEEMGYRRELAILCAAIEKWQSLGGIYSDEYGQKATTIAEELGDLPTLALVYYVMGHTRWGPREGRHWTRQSIPYFLRAIEISERIGDIQTQAMSWNNLGQAYTELGQDEQTIESWEKALDIATGTKSIFPLLVAGGVMRIYGQRGQEDIVISTFSRIMRSFASLEIDEESQARVLIAGNVLYQVYRAFRDAYRAMGKESEFPILARKVLADLLKDVNSRPQRPWYHTKLMNLNLELGDMSSAENHAKEVASIIDEMGRPDYMPGFYPAYLLLGDINTANELAYRSLPRFLFWINHNLSETEPMYRKFGQYKAFEQLCEKIEQEHGEELRDTGINQLLLKPTERPEDFEKTEFEDNFKFGSLLPSWEWLDPEGTSSYAIHHNPDRIEISAPRGSLLRYGNYSAPRLSQSICGDFAIETRMDGEKIGGVFVLKGENDITFQSYENGERIMLMSRRIIAGRGMLDAESLILRLERRNNLFRAYCSNDGENWYSCGWTEMEMDEPVQVGIFASCGWYPQAVTSFDYVKIFREEG